LFFLDLLGLEAGVVAVRHGWLECGCVCGVCLVSS